MFLKWCVLTARWNILGNCLQFSRSVCNCGNETMTSVRMASYLVHRIWRSLAVVAVTCYRIITSSPLSHRREASTPSLPLSFLEASYLESNGFCNDTSHFMFTNCYRSNQLASFHIKRQGFLYNHILFLPKMNSLVQVLNTQMCCICMVYWIK